MIRGLGLAFALLLSCPKAQAAESTFDTNPEKPGEAAPDPRPVTVVLHSDSAELGIDALRAAVEEELNLRTVSADSTESFGSRGVLTVTYRARNKELAISYSDVERGVITRIVPAPDRVADVVVTAALVAGNLVRDQTAGLVEAPPPLAAPMPAIAPLPPVANAATPHPAPLAQPAEPTRVPAYWLGNASFFFPLATNLYEPELRTNFDFNLLYGHIGQLDGLGLGTVSTVTGDVRGLELSLLTNLAGGAVHAGQISFFFNRGRTLEGLQAGFVNRADESIAGLQGGALNMVGTSSASSGAQVGVLNFAGDISGLQLGLLNVGQRVKGVQLGLVNVSDDIDGVPIGLVSVSRSGGVHPVLWSSNTTYANVGVKFATRYTYTMISGALHSDGERALYGGGLTIGASIPVANRVAVDVDVGGLHLFANTACCRDRFVGAVAREHDQSLGKLRALGRFEILKHLSLFAGTGATGRVSYPLRGNDTEIKFTLVPEFFAGVQL